VTADVVYLEEERKQFTVPSLPKKSLGRPIQVFRYRPLDWKDALTLILPGTLAVLVPLLYGFRQYRYAAHFGPVASAHWSRPWYALAALALIIFIFAAILRIRSSRRFISVHPAGLQLGLSRRQTLRWEEIAGVATLAASYHFLGIPLVVRYQGIIYPNTGKPVRLTSAIQNLPDLLSMLKAYLYPRLLPNLKSNLEDGQWLHFGPIAICREGVHLSTRRATKKYDLIPWSSVRRVNVTAGLLVVELSDQPNRKIPVARIPNFELLLQLIDEGVHP
jgi:hypothetical protein